MSHQVKRNQGGIFQIYPEAEEFTLIQRNRPDESSIGGAFTPMTAPQAGTGRLRETANYPVTSTPKIVEPKPQSSVSVSEESITSAPKIVEPKPQTSGSVRVKPATFDGTGSRWDYRAHYDAVAEINNWNQTKKGLYLAVSLRGQAQGVFGNISTQSKDYDKLVKALEERFAPPIKQNYI